ncbi:MAG TPA: asparagine synthase (glutamine-hydrolyzing) [Alphaproteobacteria bacterium]
MCGIAGALSFDPARFAVSDTLLTAMRDTMAHRGPDGIGLWRSADARVGLAHRRLAIIDLSNAALQPMSNEDGSLQIVFNGEIYNHADIRAELVAKGGHSWKTDHSDTEVILHAFEEWGIDCLAKFRGMFAFALWDARSRSLWLVRDRIGIKPLYYALDDRGVRFASEIKAILADKGYPRRVNEQALFHFLSFLASPAPATLFEGIEKLPAGSWVRISQDGQVERRRWWDALDAVEPFTGWTDQAIAERMLDELRTSVRLRKVSDVPVGVFLSGGVDSSTNLRLFAEEEGATTKAFSITYPRDQASVADEIPYAQMIARQVGAEHHIMKVTEDDLLGFVDRMVELQDEPIADPVCVPVYYVSKLARENGVTVCQVGEGADELFCGYPRWRAVLQLERMNAWPVPAPLKRLGLGALRGLGVGDRSMTEYLRRAVDGLPIFWGGAEAFTEDHKRSLLSPRLRERFHSYSSWEAIAPIRQRFESASPNPSSLAWMTYLDLNLRLPELLLMRVDKMSMGVGVEARVPFLDHRLVELALGIPAAAQLRNGNLKNILKMAVRGLIPDAIIDRRKQGFAVPMADWLRGRLGAEMAATLRKFCRQTDLLDPNAVETLIARGHRVQVWCLYNLALWWNRFALT